MRVGLVINPVAGMGGSVGLKGTDGSDILDEARRRGAVPLAHIRATEALQQVKDSDIEWVTVPGDMGENALSEMEMDYDSHPITRNGDGRDTIIACRSLIEAGIELLMFCGGDGTARDVLRAVGTNIPVIGIPAGVKMHSSVFGNHPRDSGVLLRQHIERRLPLREAEVMDIDEVAFREGRLSAELYGHVMTPYEESLVQASKSVFHGMTVVEEKESLARYFVEEMEPGCTYILGPGTTVAAITEHMSMDKTLLGVDVVKDGEFLVRDATENDLLKVLDKEERVGAIVTPIGSQGFIFGRGNQQISARVLKRLDRGNLLIIATPTKLRETKVLRVDTGDPELDSTFKGHIRVLVGYGQLRMVPVD